MSSLEKFNNSISNLSWTITTLPSEAKMFNSGDNSYSPVSDTIFNYKLPYSNTTSVIELLSVDGQLVLTTKFNGNTFKHWLNSLYEGLHIPINSDSLSIDQMASIYTMASYFRQKEDRIHIIEKLENNILKPYELLGDRVFFEGHLNRKNNVWTYFLGS